MQLLLVTLVIIGFTSAYAGDKPRMSEADPRVRYVTYKDNDVVELQVRRGVVTRVIFEAGEKIVSSGTGFDSRCDNNDLEWCIRADKDTNQVWIKPRDKATHNNIEIATNKRDYSFRVGLLTDAPNGRKSSQEMYRVIFQYPVALARLPAILTSFGKSPASFDKRAELNTRMDAHPIVRNAEYSMDAIGGGELVAPTMVFDDGRFTYFKFPNNREIPTFFAIGANNEEARVNLHVDADLVVVHRVARQFVLRLGSAVVGIWNDSYDSDGVATPNAVVVPDVSRELKEPK